MPNMSFLPEDYLEKRIQRRTNAISVSLFLIVISGVVGAYFVTNRQRDDVRLRQEQVNTRYQEAAKRLEQLDQLQAQKQEMIRKAKVTGMLLERVPRSLILAELINNMPSTLSLTELELETIVIKPRNLPKTALKKAKRNRKQQQQAAESDLPDIKPTEVFLRLIGVAPTDVQVAQFMTSLGRTEMFLDVNLLFSREIRMDNLLMREFRIESRLNPGIQIQELDLKKVRRALKQNPMGNTIQIDADGKLVIPDDPDMPQALQGAIPVADTIDNPTLQD